MTHPAPFIRPDVAAFLEMLKQIDGPTVDQVGAVEGRKQMLAMNQLTEAPARDLAVIKDVTCPGPAGDIPLRFYDTKASRDPSPVILFIHGGGFVIGDLDVYHNLCTEISYQLDLPVVSVDYRLAPEHPFPAAPDDCEAAARWVASSPAELGRTFTGLCPMGDSAGGNLTIVTAHALRAKPADVPILAQAPIYPVASDIRGDQSLVEFADGYLLTANVMAWFTVQYAGDGNDPRHTPMAGDCSNAPPTVLCTAGLDPLRDSGRKYASHLIQHGIDVSYHEFPGIIHGFTTLRKAIPSGQADLEAFLAAVKSKLS